MYEITYYSIAKPGITSREIEAILAKSRAFNAANGITGCLLYHNHQFIQVLEGDKKIIKEELLSKIDKDDRHHSVIILAESEKEERTFRDWTMAYKELNDAVMQHIGQSLFEQNFLTFSELADKPTRVISTFWHKAQRLLLDEHVV